MKLFTLGVIVIFLSSGFSCGANMLSKDSIPDSYLTNALNFIKQVKKFELQNPSFILSDKSFSFEYFECFSEVFQDTAHFTKEEIAHLKKEKILSLKWNKNDFPNLRIINGDSVDAIFTDKRGWHYFYQHFGQSFNTFSAPIFLRNNSYCLFYDDHRCGNLCGYGQLILYALKNGQWIQVKSYCDWIS